VTDPNLRSGMPKRQGGPLTLREVDNAR